MNRRRRAPAWTRWAVAGVALAAAVLAVVLAAQFLTGSLKLLNSDGPGERDPQFAEEAARETRPPELDETGRAADLEEDPSLGWVYENETPVDKTAEELSREAEAGE